MALRVFALVCSYPPLHLRLFVQMRKFVDEWSTFSPVGLLNFLLFFLAVRAISSWPTAYLVLPIFFLSFFAPFFFINGNSTPWGFSCVCAWGSSPLSLLSLRNRVYLVSHCEAQRVIISSIASLQSEGERERRDELHRPPTILLYYCSVCVCTVWKKKRVGGRARKWAQNCCYAFFLCLLLLLLWSRDLKGEEEREKIKCENVFSVANWTHPWRSERTLAVASSTHEEMRSALSSLLFPPQVASSSYQQWQLSFSFTTTWTGFFLLFLPSWRFFFAKKLKMPALSSFVCTAIIRKVELRKRWMMV